MVKKAEQQSRFPSAIALKDVLIIVGIVASIMAAWGVNGTRLALIEENASDVSVQIVEAREEYKESINKIETLLHAHELEDSKLRNHLYEIQKDFEIKIQKLEATLKNHPHKK